MIQDLLAPDLFGNEAGEDEAPEVLGAYFVDKVEFRPFYEDRDRFHIVRSRKGMGKSALLRKVLLEKEKSLPDAIVIYLKGSDLIALQPTDARTSHEHVYSWQQRICSRINVEIGRRISLAIGDDAMTLVESAELAGFKGRNIVGSLVDRLKLKFGAGEITKLASKDNLQLLERYSAKSDTSVWLLIDDVDATFVNSEDERLRTSSFFSACRNLVNAVKGLTIRASVRTDVWAIIRQHDEALDKCEQYAIDINWTAPESSLILRRKILSYFQRTHSSAGLYRHLTAERNSDKVLGLVFEPRFPWGSSTVPPDRAIYILSNARPRWAAQLCKLAALNAYKTKRDFIRFSDVKATTKIYGKARIDDLFREHRHQYEKIELLIETFARSNPKYSTRDIVAYLDQQFVAKYGLPEIDERTVKSSFDILRFMYRIGFVHLRNQGRSGGVDFIRYEDRPNILARGDDTNSFQWEIHPSYRGYLQIGKGL